MGIPSINLKVHQDKQRNYEEKEQKSCDSKLKFERMKDLLFQSNNSYKEDQSMTTTVNNKQKITEKFLFDRILIENLHPIISTCDMNHSYTEISFTLPSTCKAKALSSFEHFIVVLSHKHNNGLL